VSFVKVEGHTLLATDSQSDQYFLSTDCVSISPFSMPDRTISQGPLRVQLYTQGHNDDPIQCRNSKQCNDSCNGGPKHILPVQARDANPRELQGVDSGRLRLSSALIA